MAQSIFKLFGEIFVDNDKANKSLDETGKKAEGTGNKFSSAVGKAAKWGVGVAAAAGAGAAALFKAADSAAETADEIDKMSQKLGMSREGYQKWDYVLSQSGVEINSMATGMKTLTNKFDDAINGSDKAVASFEALGLSMEDIQGLSREELFGTVITQFQQMEDSVERAAIANDLFGKSGQELAPLFNETVESTADLKQAFDDLGMAMSDEAIDQGVKFKDSIDTIKRSFGAVFTEITSNLMPVFNDLFDWVQENMPAIKETIKKVTSVIARAIEVIKPLAKIAFSEIGFALQNVFDIFDGFFTFLDGLLDGDWERVWDGLAKIAITAIRSIINPFVRLHKMFMDIMGDSNVTIQEDSRLEDIATYGEKYYQMAKEQFTPEEYIAMYGQEAWDEVLAHTTKQALGGQTIKSGWSIVGEAGAELVQMPRGAVVTPLNDNNNAFTETNKKLDTLADIMRTLTDRLSNMGVYINGDALVGEISNGMDSALGRLSAQAMGGF